MLDERVSKFLKRHRIAVLTTLLPGSVPHGSSLHYAFSEEQFSFIFVTGKGTRKLKGMKPDEKSPASLVIGFSEEEWLTVQMEGEVLWVSDKVEFGDLLNTYAEKFIGAQKWKSDPGLVILKFTPKWWRYSEVRPEPKVIISSED